MTRARERLWLLAIVLLALGLRAAYLLEFSNDPEFTAPAVDAGYHDYWARALAFGDWRPPTDFADPLIRTTPFFRPPGYPYFLAAAYRLLGPGYLGPRIVQMLLGVFNCLLAFALARRLFGSGVALVAAFFMSFYWSFIYFEMEFLEPVAAVTLSLLLIYVLTSWTEAHSARRAAAAGVVLGLFALVRTNVLLFAVASVAWSWWISKRQGLRPTRWAALMAIYAGSAALAILPVAARNMSVAGEFVPITSNAGINLFMGNNEKANGMVAEEIPGLGPFRNCFDYPALVGALERRLGKRLRHTEVSEYFRREALAFIRQHPGVVLDLWLKKTALFWGPLEVGHNREDEIVRHHSRILSRLPGGFSLAVTLALLGLLLLAQDYWTKEPGDSGKEQGPSQQFQAVLLIVVFIAAYFASHLPFFVAGRYRIPIVPFLLLMGAFAVHRLWNRLFRSRDLRATTWLAAGAVLYMALSCIRTDYRPAEARWLFARGIAYATNRNWDGATTSFKDAVQLDHDYAEAFFGTGIALARKGDLKEAAEYLRQAVRLRSGNPDMHSTLAAVYLMSDDVESAEEAILRALRIDPNHRDALKNLSAIRARRRTLGR
jgi:4-amino-4-deoxy-L-arabinose transferase-like glycosyltransferase